MNGMDKLVRMAFCSHDSRTRTSVEGAPAWVTCDGCGRGWWVETPVERCRRLHGLEAGYVLGCDKCETKGEWP